MTSGRSVTTDATIGGETTGVDVMLMQVSQSGTSPRRRRLTQVDGVLDTADKFAQLCSVSDLPMLNRVDPYGTVILTSVEMEQFIAEIDSVRESVIIPSDLAVLADVSRLARICSHDSSMELHLEGD